MEPPTGFQQQQQAAVSVQQQQPPQFQQLPFNAQQLRPVVPQFQQITTSAPSISQSTPIAPFRQQPQAPHQHPQPFDQMQFQRGQGQGAARSTSAPTRPPASTTLFYSTPLASGFLPPEFARQGRVELESFPQAPNIAAQPTQQLPQGAAGSQQQQQQWRPVEAARTPPRSPARPQAPIPPPAAIPGFQQHQQTVSGRFPWAAASSAPTNSTPSTFL